MHQRSRQPENPQSSTSEWLCCACCSTQIERPLSTICVHPFCNHSRCRNCRPILAIYDETGSDTEPDSPPRKFITGIQRRHDNKPEEFEANCSAYFGRRIAVDIKPEVVQGTKDANLVAEIQISSQVTDDNQIKEKQSLQKLKKEDLARMGLKGKTPQKAVRGPAKRQMNYGNIGEDTSSDDEDLVATQPWIPGQPVPKTAPKYSKNIQSDMEIDGEDEDLVATQPWIPGQPVPKTAPKYSKNIQSDMEIDGEDEDLVATQPWIPGQPVPKAAPNYSKNMQTSMEIDGEDEDLVSTKLWEVRDPVSEAATKSSKDIQSAMEIDGYTEDENDGDSMDEDEDLVSTQPWEPPGY
ncbi:hypothetical protein EDC01DRAFT_632307 [Geopyxis carbonaria]|nr:hypothetical protein EDC01DRAFT_632307 [Geopyxis carbonaria]